MNYLTLFFFQLFERTFWLNFLDVTKKAPKIMSIELQGLKRDPMKSRPVALPELPGKATIHHMFTSQYIVTVLRRNWMLIT